MPTLSELTLHFVSPIELKALQTFPVIVKQIRRSKRAEMVRDRQRAVLLQLIVETMADLEISCDEIAIAHRAYVDAKASLELVE